MRVAPDAFVVTVEVRHEAVDPCNAARGRFNVALQEGAEDLCEERKLVGGSPMLIAGRR